MVSVTCLVRFTTPWELKIQSNELRINKSAKQKRNRHGFSTEWACWHVQSESLSRRSDQVRVAKLHV